ncbi:hypothetical protein [Streptomyces wuyuanensis]|uniref:hypothetical protein n=1 Tax=Streptomyces wuyuanensis TaxID=1196353 RepID=UPI0037939E33
MTDARSSGGMLSAVDHDAVERVKAELRDYAVARAEYLLASLGRGLGQAVVTLHDIADGRSPGFARLALDGGRKLSQGKSPMRAAVELGASRLKDNITGRIARRVPRTGDDRGPAVVVESVDVGVPVSRAYDLWTRQEALPAFAMGSRDEKSSDETGVVWTSRGTKGSVDGAVSFHAIGDTLTRVLLVVEYHPRGLVERAGALLGTPSRRARLDLTGFARRVAMRDRDQDREDRDRLDAGPDGPTNRDDGATNRSDGESDDHEPYVDETYGQEPYVDETYDRETARVEAGTGGTT